MAAADLSVEELIQQAVVYLGEELPPVDAFCTILDETSERVKCTDPSGGVYQVEVTGTVPTAADNVTNYVSGLTTGAQDAVAVTTESISVLQTKTRTQARQGIKFDTALRDGAKGLSHAIWDKCTAMFLASSATDAGAAAAATVLTTAEIRTLRTSVNSRNVNLLIEHSSSENVYPDNNDSFAGFQGTGAFGFERIYPVTNFTGGITNMMALAADPVFSVAVTGLPLEDSRSAQLVGNAELKESVVLPNLSIPVEMRIWEEQNTRDVHLTLEAIFGISEADSAAAAFLDHA